MDLAKQPRLKELFAPGTMFEGKYRIERSLGAGNFAYVLLATHTAMDRNVALKVLKPELVGGNPELIERFVTEVKIVSKLTHANTVTVFDYGKTSDGIHYLVMEYVDGVSLAEVLAEAGPLSPHRVSAITQQILKSLAEAHAHGIVHRDLKPSNIMLTKTHDGQEVVKVLDFGVAKLTGHRAPDQPERRSTQFIGTPVYMSPEQVLGEAVVPASDLYGLGLIVYEMLTGEAPFRGEAVALIAQAHIEDEPLPLARLDELSSKWQTLVRRATAREVSDRFGDVSAFARALGEIGGSSVSDEFAKLQDNEIPFGRPEGLDDVSDATWEAFAGRNYVEAPEPADAPAPAPRRSGPVRPPPRQPADDDNERRQVSGSVALDVGHVRREELRRKREQSGPLRAMPRRDWRVWAWLGAGGLAAFVAFTVASTVWVDQDGGDRWLIGLIPVALAAVWTQFSATRRHHGDFVEASLLPLARHLVMMALGVVVIVCVVSPEAGASRMNEAGAWFVSDVEAGSVLYPLRAATELLCRLLAGVFSIASKVLPW